MGSVAVLEMTSCNPETIRSTQESFSPDYTDSATINLASDADDTDSGESETVKINIDNEKIPASEKGNAIDKQDFAIKPSTGLTVEFTEAPEPANRVYDFNMVKQKTLPRISFQSMGACKVCSGRSPTHIFVWVLMSTSIVVCIVVLVWFLVRDTPS